MNFRFPRGREPFNGWSHLFATVLAVIGAVILIADAWHQGAMLYAKIFFAATLIAAYASSAIYHLAITTPERLRILRNIDHACILALMVGTYIPLSVAMFSARENMFLISGFLALLATGWVLAGNKNRRMVSRLYMTLATLPALRGCTAGSKGRASTRSLLATVHQHLRQWRSICILLNLNKFALL
jgi:channel protein (hemolysin III family)